MADAVLRIEVIRMTFGRDREYARSSALPEWMKAFAEEELNRKADGSNPFQDIQNIFKTDKALNAVDEKVTELRSRIGLDKLEADVDSGLVATASLDVRRLRADAVRELIALASSFEQEGNAQAVELVDRMIVRIKRTADAEKSSDLFEGNSKLKTFIDNVCSSRGGHVSVPAIMKMIRDERPENIEASDKLRDYIKDKLKDERQEVSDGGDDMAGIDVGMSVTQQDKDDNNRMFQPPDGDLS